MIKMNFGNSGYIRRYPSSSFFLLNLLRNYRFQCSRRTLVFHVAAVATLSVPVAVGGACYYYTKNPTTATTISHNLNEVSGRTSNRGRVRDIGSNDGRGSTFQSQVTTFIRQLKSSARYCSCDSASTKQQQPEPSKVAATTTEFPPRSEKISIAAQYFKENGKLPQPKIMHAVLDEPIKPDYKPLPRILIVGDIHGCYDELQLLVQKAVGEYNYGSEFEYVISVGDMVNKGPKSVQVVQQFRTTPNWLAIRGNHDDAAIGAVLKGSIKNDKYRWLEQLSVQDIEWMLELPYTIRIPPNLLNDITNIDTVLVHAGFVPGKELNEQSIDSMVTIRDVINVASDTNDDTEKSYVDYQQTVRNDPDLITKLEELQQIKKLAWADVWDGPYRVIFGHDAKRGLQIHNEWAIGLDSGCCYGKKLTGMILPDRILVQVNALAEHCPISTTVAPPKQQQQQQQQQSSSSSKTKTEQTVDSSTKNE